MKTLKYLAAIFAIIISLYSCYEEDPIILSTASEGSGRFDFPQGASAHDQRIKEVFDKFGVKIIYKDFNNIDFNRSWTTPAIGKVGYDVVESQQADAANFMVDHIFKYLTPDITKRVLPPYFYIADSIHQVNIFSESYISRSVTNYFYTGLDFWMFTWNGIGGYTKIGENTNISAPLERPNTPFSYFYRRGVMLKEVYKKAVLNGNITVPEGFNDGFDFITKIETAASKETDPNYYKTRGFPGQFTNTLRFDQTILPLINYTNPQQNFADYLLLCMRYQPDSIEVLFPKAKFPKIHQKYPIAIKHMKDTYGIDLNELSTKPTL